MNIDFNFYVCNVSCVQTGRKVPSSLFLNCILSLTPHCLHLNHVQLLGDFPNVFFFTMILSLRESYIRKLGTTILYWHLCPPVMTASCSF